MENNLDLFVHQRKLIKWPYEYKELEFIFLIGGYACGKSLADVAAILAIAKRYQGWPVVCAICSTTITLYRKTIWLDLVKWLVMCKIPYRYDKQENVLQIGTVKFLIIPTEQPELIYGPNVSISIFDEIDELPQDKALLAFTAISERTRIPLPDGRKPYMLFTTTAQGLKGVYQITEELRDKNMNFAIIRGLTKDNTSLDPAYYQRLWNLYDDNERRAYLNGEFVNLSAGRVYPGYDEQLHMIDDMEPTENETIFIGQDLNSGYSKATAWIKRGKKLICIKDFSFKEIGMAPQILRRTFPSQELIWYPDASSKEIMKGYTDEIAAQDIKLRIGTVNPPIIDRIFMVNKGFQTDRLAICRSCKSLSMGLKTRQYDDNGKPEKGSGEKAPDHVCLSGDTLIATNRGNIRIDSIKNGDYALTRKGYKKIINAWQTGIREVKEYQFGNKSLVSTSDHPVWTTEGFKYMVSLTQSDILYTIDDKEIALCQKLQSIKSYLMELFIEDTQTPRMKVAENITAVASRGNGLRCIGTSGKLQMVKYLMGMMSIISITIILTMIFQILNVLKQKNTIHTMELKIQQLIEKKIINFLKKSGHLRQLGILQKREGNGIQNTQKKIRRFSKKVKLFANAAKNYLSGKLTDRNFVQKVVYQNIGGDLELTTLKEHARFAEQYLPSTNMQKLDAAQKNAEALREKRAKKIPVYNLTVEDEHEYFANGILVSNCDCSEYILWRVMTSDADFRDLYECTRSFRGQY